MCSDDHVDRSVLQPLSHPTCLGGCQKPAQYLDPHGVGSEPVAKGLTVLLCQKGGRNEDRCLAAVLDGLEHGPHRHLGLTEADVAADETVHRQRPFHISLDVLDGLKLVWCLLVGKRLFQFPLPWSVVGEGVTDRPQPLLVEEHQLLGDLGHRRPDPGLGLLPVRSPHPAEARLLATGVGANHVDLVGRKVKAVIAPVLEQQVIALDSSQGAGNEAGEPGYTMVFVHDMVTGGKVLKDANSCGSAGFGSAAGSTTARDLGLGHDRQARRGQHEPPLKGRHDQMGTRRRRVCLRSGCRHLDSGLQQPLAEPLHAPFAVRNDDQPDAVCQQVSQAADYASCAGISSTGCRVPARCGDGLHPGALGDCIQRPHGSTGVGEQPVPTGVEAWKVGHVGSPGFCQRVGQGGLLGLQVRDPVTKASGLDRDNQGVVVQQIEEDPFLSGKPWHP